MIKLSYDKKDDLPKGHEALYKEKDKKWVLTEIEGLKTQEDINKLNEAMNKERNDHKESKAKLASWLGLGKELDDVEKELNRIPELELSAKEGKIDEKEMAAIIEVRLKAANAPLERERKKVDDELIAFKAENQGLKNAKTRRTIEDEIRHHAVASKVIPEAVSDLFMIASEQFEITPEGVVLTNEASGQQGMSAEAWITTIKDKKPYLWELSEGGGARGSGAGGAPGNNPFTKEHWNVTEQGKILVKNEDVAIQLAKAAGSAIGATEPPADKK